MIFAWYATLICVIFSAWIAAAFLRDEPILFTVMALLAFTWVLLLPYYGGARNEGRPELVEVYTGFLTVYVGALLTLYAANSQGQKRPQAVVEWQYAALGFLLIVAVPSAPGLLSPDGSGGFVKLSWHQADLLIGVGLGIAGFVAIVRAMKKFCGDVEVRMLLKTPVEETDRDGNKRMTRGQRNEEGTRQGGAIPPLIAKNNLAKYKRLAEQVSKLKAYVILATILFLYALIGVIWTIYSWRESKAEMESSFAYFFAAMKLAYTLTLGAILAYHTMTPGDKRQGPWHWILILFAVRQAERKKRSKQ